MTFLITVIMNTISQHWVYIIYYTKFIIWLFVMSISANYNVLSTKNPSIWEGWVG